MKRIAAIVLAALVLSPVGASAGPILQSAERLVREAAAAAAQGGTRQRSAVRTWSGVGLLAGGVALAFSRRDCRVAGLLSTDSAVRVVAANAVGAAGIVFDDARSATAEKSSGRCFLDWTVDGTPVVVTIFGSVVGDSVTGTASEFRSDFPEVDETRGTARAESYWPKGQLYGGLALAAVGGLLATIWAEVDVLQSVDLSVSPGRFQVGRTFGF